MVIGKWLRPLASALPLWSIMGIACGLPLAWLVAQLVMRPELLASAGLGSYGLKVIGRTLLYNAGASLLACAMALPAAIVIGRGRPWARRLLLAALPASLLVPSLVWGYGWSQLLDMLGAWPVPQSADDVLRCIWSLATWLWGIPAVGVGLYLRTADSEIQQQALIDGGLWRVSLRLLAGPMVACFCATMVLAVQEFAIYEPTGVSVVATEVRAVFQTGVLSSGWTTLGGDLARSPDDAHRAAAAVATAAPLLAIIGLLCLVGVVVVRRLAVGTNIDPSPWPRSLDAGRIWTAAAMALLAMNTALPLGAMVASLRRPPELWRVYEALGSNVAGSLLIGGMTGLGVLAVTALALMRKGVAIAVLSGVTFLVGGQLVGIASLRLYNRPFLSWVADGPWIVALAHGALFAWIGLLAARTSWSGRWTELRDLAAVDGANPWRTARGVIGPLIWPLVAVAALLAMILSITEVPATAVLQPLRPKVLITHLLTWVHMQRSDDMIEASLAMVLIVLLLAMVLRPLIALAMRVLSRTTGSLLPVLCCLLLVGCGKSAEPDEVWCSTGLGPGQVVYPRAIAYAKQTNTFFVVDRAARIQRLDSRGAPQAEWQMPLWTSGKPVGLSVGPDGNLYVPDTHYNRVMVYSPDGRLLGQWGSEGKEPGQFVWPTDVAFDRQGNIYVSEYGGNDRIQVFAACDIAAGPPRFLRQFGRFGAGPGEFSRPQSMVIDGDTLYVTDACNHRIQVFRTDGSFVRGMGRVGGAVGEFRFPYGLDMDAKGRLVVCEFGNNRVQLVDKDTGQGLANWGEGGRERGQLAYPWAVAVRGDGKVVVVDSGNNRLQVFGF